MRLPTLDTTAASTKPTLREGEKGGVLVTDFLFFFIVVGDRGYTKMSNHNLGGAGQRHRLYRTVSTFLFVPGSIRRPASMDSSS